ncbi:hypothetical protein ONZ45_g7740 [Pleurotus djamor]|nr:hypothetical protein ONZ45_g7740 [Pleurotus djamor]
MPDSQFAYLTAAPISKLPSCPFPSYTLNVFDFYSLSHGIVPIDVPPVDIEIDFAEDPRSPSAAGLTSPPPAFHRFVRFATLSPHSPLPSSLSPSSARDCATVASGTASYPRSPYPVASSPPLTPAQDEDSAPMEPKMKPRRVVAWKGHGELRLSDLFAAPSISSPLRQSHFSNAKTSKVTTPSPQASSPSIASVSSKPPPLDLNSGSDVDSECSNPSSQLRKAFWRSVSLVDLHDEDAAASAWSYPPSAVELQEFLAEQADSDIDQTNIPRLSVMSPVPLSAAPLSAVPDYVMGRKREMLWSPGLPMKKHSVDVPESVTSDSEDDDFMGDRNHMKGYTVGDYDGDLVDLTSILSPGAQREVTFTMNPPPRSTVAAPSPNDPFAAFPSFSAVLHLHGALGEDKAFDCCDGRESGKTNAKDRTIDVELD